MTVDKVIAKIIWLTFFGPPCTLYNDYCMILHQQFALRHCTFYIVLRAI